MKNTLSQFKIALALVFLSQLATAQEAENPYAIFGSTQKVLTEPTGVIEEVLHIGSESDEMSYKNQMARRDALLKSIRASRVEKYRFGFNGKENDTDFGSGIQDYGMRIYCKPCGRFLSEDPITAKYPMLTPYQFASNTPIRAIDLDGLEGILPEEAGDKNLLRVEHTSKIESTGFRTPPVNAIRDKITANPSLGLTINLDWTYYQSRLTDDLPKITKYISQGGFSSRHPVAANSILNLSMIVDSRPHPLGLSPQREPVNTLAGQFDLLLGNQGKENRASNGEYTDVFRHQVIQGLVSSLYGDNIATQFGNSFEQGADPNSAFGSTANPGFESYQDLVNNELGRRYMNEYTTNGGNLSTLEGFTSYLNFVATKVLAIGSRRNHEMEDANVEFSQDNAVVQDLFNEYNNARE